MSLTRLYIEQQMIELNMAKQLAVEVTESSFTQLPGARLITGEIAADGYDHTVVLRLAYDEMMFGHPDA
jgi:hypothetical protein